MYGNNYHRYIRDVQAKHPRAYTMWTTEDERRLTEMAHNNWFMSDIARALGRQESGIFARMEKLGLSTKIEEREEIMTRCYHVIGIDNFGALEQLASSENEDDVLRVAGSFSKGFRQLFLVARGVSPQELTFPAALGKTNSFSPRIKGLGL